MGVGAVVGAVVGARGGRWRGYHTMLVDDFTDFYLTNVDVI